MGLHWSTARVAVLVLRRGGSALIGARDRGAVGQRRGGSAVVSARDHAELLEMGEVVAHTPVLDDAPVGSEAHPMDLAESEPAPGWRMAQERPEVSAFEPVAHDDGVLDGEGLFYGGGAVRERGPQHGDQSADRVGAVPEALRGGVVDRIGGDELVDEL